MDPSVPLSSLNRFTKTGTLTAKADELFRWHARPATFKRLFPSWMDPRKYTFVLTEAKENAIIKVSRKLPKIFSIFDLFSYTLKYTSVKENSSFTTLMIRGPYAYWSHELSFLPREVETKVKDQILYKAYGGRLGQKWLAPSIRRDIRRTLNYRQRLAESDLNVLKTYDKNPLLRIVISGAAGFVGDTLASFLKSAGHEVLCLVRDKKHVDDTHIYWNPEKGEIALSLLNNCDALINLSGARVDGGHWSASQRALLRRSRIETTRFLLESLDQLDNPPPTLLSASACGYYGFEEERAMEEKDPQGKGFLAKLCADWEEAAASYASRGLGRRTVRLRFGMILGARGGALSKMALGARMGILPYAGSGQQKISWTSIDDAVYAIYHLLQRREITGPVNICTPEPVTNEQLTRLLLKLYGKSFTFKTPEKLLELALGRMAKELLLSKTWMTPSVLQESKFRWEYSSLEETLRHQLGILPTE